MIQLILLAGLTLQIQSVDAHGQGPYRLGETGRPYELKKVESRRAEDWLNNYFRPEYNLPPAENPHDGARLGKAPRYEGLGEPVMARYDDRGMLVVFDRPLTIPAVDHIYDIHHRYHVLYQVVREIPRKAPPTGRPDWVLDLENLFPGILEMRDLHLVDDRLYVNIQINGYASILDGKTGYVACIDVTKGELLWRTGPLVSNAPMLIDGDHLITGYGFTAEPDFIYVLDRDNGATVQKIRIPTAMEDLEIEEDRLYVKTYDHYMVFEIERP